GCNAMPKRRRFVPFPTVLLSLAVLTAAVAGLRAYVFPSAATTVSRSGGTAQAGHLGTRSRSGATTSSKTSATNAYAATASGDLSPAVQGIPARVYVPNGVAGTVEEIDPRTYRIIRRF